MMFTGTLITANAGCGKTYSLANRVIGWMIEHRRLTQNAGAADILAATFTRKAAGEIQDRILEHLALGAMNPKALKAFNDENAFKVDPPAAAEDLQGVLQDVVKCLDRLQINTLDGIFHRLAKGFPEEVGFPEGWIIADHPALASIQRQAIDDWLESCGADEIETLAIEAEGEILKGSPHGTIIKTIWGGPKGGGLLPLWRRSQVGNDNHDPWEWIDGLTDDVLCSDARRATATKLASAANTLETLEIPLTKAGTEVKAWVKANDRMIQAIRAGFWSDVLTEGIVVAAASGGKFAGHFVPADFETTLRPVISHARADLVRRIRLKIKIWRELLGELDHAYQSRQREVGMYDFSDITDRLARAEILNDLGAEQLAWRLDSAIRDMALDEFQDTSMEQAHIIEPVIEEMLAGQGAHDTPRNLLVVADPKQSIYAWRGGTPAVLDWLERLGQGQIKTADLHRSFRSAKRIMDFVNSVFENMDTNATLNIAAENHQAVPEAIMKQAGLEPGDPDGPVAEVRNRWVFTHHESAKTELRGGVQAWLISKDKDEVFDHAVSIIKRRHDAGVGVGVLCPTNDQVSELCHRLRCAGVPVSEEGAGGASEIPAVSVLLDVLRLGDHPGHRQAAFNVSHSPFAEAVGLDAIETLPWGDRDATLEHVSNTIRAAIADVGLGEYLAELVRGVEEQCDSREQVGLRLVTELAASWTTADTRRLGDFIAIIEGTGFGEPTPSPVRVMTQHAAKGLEFDEVVLPWLDRPLVKGRALPCLPWSKDPLDPIKAIAPSFPEKQRVHAPILEAFHNQGYAAEMEYTLSLLYVSITRPRTGLHLMFQPPKKDERKSVTAALFLRSAIPAIDHKIDTVDPGSETPFWEFTDSDWPTAADSTAAADSPPPTPVRIAPIGNRAKVVTPSSHEGTGTFQERFRLLPGRARRDGVILHELYRAIAWLDDGPPSEADVERAFNEAAIQLGRPVGSDLRASLTERFHKSLTGEVGSALRRGAHEAWNAVTLEALPEHPILVQLDSGMLRGRIDRLVLGRDDSGAVTHAAILDFKTGKVETQADRQAATEWYQPQLDRYAEGIAAVYNLPPEAIETGLLFVQ